MGGLDGAAAGFRTLIAERQASVENSHASWGGVEAGAEASVWGRAPMSLVQNKSQTADNLP